MSACVLSHVRCRSKSKLNSTKAVHYAFDILWLNGRDMRNLPLVERKKILRKVIPRKSSSVGCVSYVDRGRLSFSSWLKNDRNHSQRRSFSSGFSVACSI